MPKFECARHATAILNKARQADVPKAQTGGWAQNPTIGTSALCGAVRRKGQDANLRLIHVSAALQLANDWRDSTKENVNLVSHAPFDAREAISVAVPACIRI
jgi:hypothetical protein